MPHRPDDLQALTQRLDRLERQNRRYRLTLLGVVTLAVAAVCLTAWRPAPAVADDTKIQAKSARPEVTKLETVQADRVITQQLELRDAAGAVRAVMSTAQGSALKLMDAKGVTRATLGISAKGTPLLALFNADGATQLTALGPAGGGGHVVVFNAAGKPSASIP